MGEVEEASHEWKRLYQEAEEARAVEGARLEDERDAALAERDDFERRLDEAEAIIDDQVASPERRACSNQGLTDMFSGVRRWMM